MVNSVLARRSSMDRKKAGGMMVNNLQLKVECPYGVSFKEACEKLTKEQFEYTGMEIFHINLHMIMY